MRAAHLVERARTRRARRQTAVVAVTALVGGLMLLVLAGRSGVRSAEPVELMKIDSQRMDSIGRELAGGDGPDSGEMQGQFNLDRERGSEQNLEQNLNPDLRPLSGPQVRLAHWSEHTAASTARFNGRPLRKVKTLSMLVTAYSPDERSCGKSADGITASGYSVWTNGMKMVAADTRILPMGSLVSVPGYHEGKPVPVLDRGGKIKGHRLDLLYPTHEIARRWGAQRLTVTVWAYAD
jgi:3D (Asp-Asp-Asp) domain-containing protein